MMATRFFNGQVKHVESLNNVWIWSMINDQSMHMIETEVNSNRFYYGRVLAFWWDDKANHYWIEMDGIEPFAAVIL